MVDPGPALTITPPASAARPAESASSLNATRIDEQQAGDVVGEIDERDQLPRASGDGADRQQYRALAGGRLEAPTVQPGTSDGCIQALQRPAPRSPRPECLDGFPARRCSGTHGSSQPTRVDLASQGHAGNC